LKSKKPILAVEQVREPAFPCVFSVFSGKYWNDIKLLAPEFF
jgi:hypothetical protein